MLVKVVPNPKCSSYIWDYNPKRVLGFPQVSYQKMNYNFHGLFTLSGGRSRSQRAFSRWFTLFHAHGVITCVLCYMFWGPQSEYGKCCMELFQWKQIKKTQQGNPISFSFKASARLARRLWKIAIDDRLIRTHQPRFACQGTTEPEIHH